MNINNKNLKDLINLYSNEFMNYNNVKFFFIPKPYDFKNFAKNIHLYNENSTQSIICPMQTHSNDVIVIENQNIEFPIYGDALITARKKLCICITTADCLPILLYEFKQKVIAIIHAGWRGLYSEIIKKTISEMISDYNCNPLYIKVLIGPSICVNHYEIGVDLFFLIKDKFNFFNKIVYLNENKIYLNIKKFAELQLNECGIISENIKISEICTYENEKFYSARRDGKETGRFLSGIFMI